LIAAMAYAYVLGLLSILTPCTLIIVPVLTADITAKRNKIMSFLGGVLVMFGALGVLSAVTGKLLTNFVGPYLYLFAGIVTLVSGLYMLGVVKFGFSLKHGGVKTTFAGGLLYGGVMLSCVGPLLASVMVYITATGSVMTGLVLMSLFSLGFLTPFILYGFLITDKKVVHKLMKYAPTIQKVGGVVLILVSAYLLWVAMGGLR